jgi:hypothetical protein
MLVQLKLLQRLGYLVPLASVPPAIIEHICERAGWRKPNKAATKRYDQSGSKSVRQQALREFVGIRMMDESAQHWLEQQAMLAAQTKQELPDIINVLIEELVQRRFELPGFTYLFRLARESRAAVNDRIYKSVVGSLAADAVESLDQLLETGSGQSAWDGLKAERAGSDRLPEAHRYDVGTRARPAVDRRHPSDQARVPDARDSCPGRV